MFIVLVWNSVWETSVYWKNEASTSEEQDVIYLLLAIQYILQIRISSYVAYIQMLILVVSYGCAGQCSSRGEKLDFVSTALNMKCWGTQNSWSTKRVLVVWIMQMKVPLRWRFWSTENLKYADGGALKGMLRGKMLLLSQNLYLQTPWTQNLPNSPNNYFSEHFLNLLHFLKDFQK